MFLRVIQGLLRVDPAKFWAPYVEVVETTLDEHVAEVDRLVKRTVAAASLAFKTRLRVEEPLVASGLGSCSAVVLSRARSDSSRGCR